MMGRAIFCLIVCLAIEISEGFFTDLHEWDTIRVTYWKFNQMPLTRKDAESQNFVQIGGKNAPCKGQFYGYRYLKKNDSAVMLLYDINGYFAGIQIGYAEAEITDPALLKWFKQNSMFAQEVLPYKNAACKSKSYTLTAYLVEPEIICSTGRTPEQFHDSEGGLNLYLAFADNSRFLFVPKAQSALKNTPWVETYCVPWMGTHFFYNTSEQMDCNDFLPTFLLYVFGHLRGFGAIVPGYFSSQRFEHFPKAVFKVPGVPECLRSFFERYGELTAEHIYMNFNWWNLFC